MANKALASLVLIGVTFVFGGCYRTTANGPHGPEVVTSDGPLGGGATYNGGPAFRDCMKYANMDPTLTPMMKYDHCRATMPGAGAGMMGGYGYMSPYGAQIITPFQSGVMASPGSAAVVSGPPPTVYAPGTTTVIVPGKDKAARNAIIEQDDRLNKLEKRVCKGGCK